MCKMHFNPRSPHGERRNLRRDGSTLIAHFNPRSPHGERRRALDFLWLSFQFQSTLPARGATRNAGLYYRGCNISIHAPRTGSDAMALCCFLRHNEFQSTLPARGATRHRRLPQRVLDISIHAPRTGSDLCALAVIVRLVISIHAPRTGSDSV